MKKICCLLGSPRSGGNSETIARKIIETAEALGATSEVFRLYQMDFRGCIACLGCKRTSEECVLRDDLTEALRSMRQADILIMASPVYFAALTGPLKCAIDRMYSHVAPTYLSGGPITRLDPGKKCAFVLTQGAADVEAFANLYPSCEGFFGPQWFGYEMHLIHGCGLSLPTDAGESVELMQQAEALGRKLMG